jgi:hypothetical protein
LARKEGAFDLTLDFGRKVGEADPQFDARVSMSWEHALALRALLDRMIANFEEKIGAVPDIEAVAAQDEDG